MAFSIVSNWRKGSSQVFKTHIDQSVTQHAGANKGSWPWARQFSSIRAISRDGTPPPEPLANNILSSWGNVPWADVGATAASTHQALRGQCSRPIEDFIIPLSFNLPDFFLEESGFWTQILSLLGISVQIWENKIAPLLMAILLACRVQSLLSQAVLPVLWVPPVCKDHS